jgi:hypothetical protein
MKITVRQLKALIRESVEEAMNEMGDVDHEKMEETKVEEEVDHEKMEETIQEAVAKAYRAGFRKGRAARR